MDSVSTVRARLLEKCTAHYTDVSRRGDSSGRLIRRGLLAGESAILNAPDGADALVWIERVIGEMDSARAGVADPFDEDGWTSGGVRWVQNLLEKERDELRKQPSNRVDPTVALLRLAAAVRRAFPDRAEEILAAVDLWFHAPVNPSCSLCGGSFRGAFAAAKTGSPEFSRFRRPEPGLDLMLCERCTQLSGPAGVPTEKILVDLLRAIRAESRDGEEALCAELERRFAARTFRGTESGACATCGDSGLCAQGRVLFCFPCISRARDALTALPEPTLDTDLAAADLARRIRVGLAAIRSTHLVAEFVVLDPGMAYDIDLLIATQALSPMPRALLFGAIDELTAAILGGVRVFRNSHPPFDDRSEEFERLDRWRHPELGTAPRDAAPLLITGAAAEVRRHTAVLLHFAQGDDRDALWRLGDGAESSSAAEIPDGSMVFVADLFSLGEGEIEKLALAITEQRWRVLVGIAERESFSARCQASPHAAIAALAQAPAFVLTEPPPQSQR